MFIEYNWKRRVVEPGVGQELENREELRGEKS